MFDRFISVGPFFLLIYAGFGSGSRNFCFSVFHVLVIESCGLAMGVLVFGFLVWSFWVLVFGVMLLGFPLFGFFGALSLEFWSFGVLVFGFLIFGTLVWTF